MDETFGVIGMKLPRDPEHWGKKEQGVRGLGAHPTKAKLAPSQTSAHSFRSPRGRTRGRCGGLVGWNMKLMKQGVDRREMKFGPPSVVRGFLKMSLFLVEFLDPGIPSRSPMRRVQVYVWLALMVQSGDGRK